MYALFYIAAVAATVMAVTGTVASEMSLLKETAEWNFTDYVYLYVSDISPDVGVAFS